MSVQVKMKLKGRLKGAVNVFNVLYELQLSLLEG